MVVSACPWICPFDLVEHRLTRGGGIGSPGHCQARAYLFAQFGRRGMAERVMKGTLPGYARRGHLGEQILDRKGDTEERKRVLAVVVEDSLTFGAQSLTGDSQALICICPPILVR